VAPSIKKTAASLQRAAVKVFFAANRGDLADAEAGSLAERLLAQLSETERASLTSRGDRRHAVRDLTKFKQGASAYLNYVDRETLRGHTQETPDPDAGKRIGSQPVRQAEDSDSDDLYRLPETAAQARTARAAPGPAFTTPPSQQIAIADRPRKRGPNRSWQDHRLEQSWESSFSPEESDPESSESEIPEIAAANLNPILIAGGQVETDSHRSEIAAGNDNALPICPAPRPPSPRTPPGFPLRRSPRGFISPLRTLPPLLSLSPASPRPRSAPSSLHSTLELSPAHLSYRLLSADFGTGVEQGRHNSNLSHLSDAENAAATTVDRSILLPDRPPATFSSPSAGPAVDQSIQLPNIQPPVIQETERDNPLHSGPPASWSESIPATPPPETFFYSGLSPRSARESCCATASSRIEILEANMSNHEDAMQAMREDFAKQIAALTDMIQKQGAKPDEAVARAESRVRLEAEKQQKLLDLEAELRTKFTDAGIGDEFAGFTADANVGRTSEKVESPKMELIGILNPLPGHKVWTGQAVDSNGHWISFAKWLAHLEGVLAQKQSATWKRACLDVAALMCLRGRALDWWHSLTADQHKLLREDASLKLWNTLGKALHRNEQILRKEARDRKRAFGETLSEYAWVKFAMIQEAFGRNRDAADVIADIKDGLTPTDQEIIQSDMAKRPSITRFMDELARLDKIRGLRFKSAIEGASSRPAASPQRRSPYATPPKPPLAETYDQKELKMRVNPMAPDKTAQWSYRFPDGRTILLSSPCSKCGGKHFNFECKKDQRTVARAAFMMSDSPRDESSPTGTWDDYEEEEEDDLGVAYVAYSGIDNYDPDQYRNSRGQRQITTEPWSEMSDKKEN
jgi:hypothetical protein